MLSYCEAPLVVRARHERSLAAAQDDKWPLGVAAASREHFGHHAAVHVRQPALDAVVVEGQALVVDAEQVEHRGVQVVDRSHVLDSLVAEVVGGAEAEAALYAGAGEPDREALWVVVAAAG